MQKPIGEIKKQYEKIQRVLFIFISISGISIITYGIISHIIPNLVNALSWTGYIGTGMGIFGGVGTFLTTRHRVKEINEQKSDNKFLRKEYRSQDNKFITNYISTPTQAILILSLFIISGILMLLGVLNFLYWLGNRM